MPFVLIPQVWSAPGADRGECAGRRRGLAEAIVAPAGDGAARPHPQEWNLPALTAVKVPGGGVAWPSALRPQQATVPSVLIPQVWRWPALTAAKVPAGGVALPKPLSPQQARVPFAFIPQV